MKFIRVKKAFINLNEAFDDFEEIYFDDSDLEEAKSLGILTGAQVNQIKKDNKESLQNGVYAVEGWYFNDNIDYDSAVAFKKLMK